MKNRILIILLVIIIAIGGGLAVHQKVTKEMQPEEFIEDVLKAKQYTTNITYVVKNSRGEFKEKGQIYYNKEEGTKITLDNKEQLFKDDKIKITYFNENQSYEVPKSYDKFYKYLFINEISEFLINDESKQIYWDTSDTQKKAVVEFMLPEGNQNFYKEVLIVDYKTKSPSKIIIYDKNGQDRIEANFENFQI